MRDTELLSLATINRSAKNDDLELQQLLQEQAEISWEKSAICLFAGWPLNLSRSARSAPEDGRMGAHVARDQRPTPAEYLVTRPFDSSS